MGSLFLFFSANECPLALVLLSCAIYATLPREIISKMYLIENKEVTLLYKLNR